MESLPPTVPMPVFLATIAVLATPLLMMALKPAPKMICNPEIEKDKEKVATIMTVDALGKAVKDNGVVAYCRCWRSAKFPLCDGSHAKFNKETGDNTGPLVIKPAARATSVPVRFVIVARECAINTDHLAVLATMF
jgi:CDGSH-type Zn-finger protein